MIIPDNKVVTECCPNCGSEIIMEWDVSERGYKAFCPVCGERLMLCGECLYDGGDRCDFDSKSDTCKHNPGSRTNNKKSDKKETEDGFLKFWQAYPKKTAKQAALKAWNKLKPDEVLLKTIINALEIQKKSDQWHKEGGQYIPYPATWINGRRWEDEPNESGSGKPKESKPSYNLDKIMEFTKNNPL